ncbi:hypothetical protein THMIRHAS_09230 [Thiosulfatimonas sediminis]|uniref:Flagellar protein n=1 Tax=Thiosulfatimonas sediminis TaxID=2675054 RepID=A0A6F8PU97_9GAMM|nr:flagellar biosynthetic protein FliO [Thiosulfatimonas sediminis]BBP45550.1 hypothetical protein THMIRHAS_09230 [Thiosulfatimonas sediminis]
MLSKNRYSKRLQTQQVIASLLSSLFLAMAMSLLYIGSAAAADVPQVGQTSLAEPMPPTVQFGQTATQPSDYFLQILLSLIFILLIIFLAAWLLRRYGRFPGVADGNLKVLGALSVGPRERILMLQVGKEQILVGVTSSKISKLHQLVEPVQIADPVPVGGVFAQRLQEAMQGVKSATVVPKADAKSVSTRTQGDQ